jgi:hypothetical protein
MMGTRSLTYVYDENNTKQPITCMYRQFDGYPSAHGAELAEFLTPMKTREEGRNANGMGCLAAQMVAYFKEGAYNVYLYFPELGQDCWQEYEYHVFSDKVVVQNPTEVIFSGSWREFTEFCCDELVS